MEQSTGGEHKLIEFEWSLDRFSTLISIHSLSATSIGLGTRLPLTLMLNMYEYLYPLCKNAIPFLRTYTFRYPTLRRRTCLVAIQDVRLAATTYGDFELVNTYIRVCISRWIVVESRTFVRQREKFGEGDRSIVLGWGENTWVF